MSTSFHCTLAHLGCNLLSHALFCFDAGVATAFAAPIGGLLFTVEEGVSFYSTSIFWRGFLSTGIGVFTLHFLVECAVSVFPTSRAALQSSWLLLLAPHASLCPAKA